MSNYAEDFERELARARHWRLETLSVRLLSKEQKNLSLEALFLAEFSNRLDFATPEEAPLIKAIAGWISLNRRSMDAPVLAAAERYLEDRKTELQSYISQATPGTEFVRVTASLRADGTVIPDSVRVFRRMDEGRVIDTPREEVLRDQALAEQRLHDEVFKMMSERFGVSSGSP